MFSTYSTHYFISKKILLIYILLFFFFITSYQVKAADNFNIEQQLEKYEEMLKKRYVDPVRLEIKLTEKETASWLGLRFRLRQFNDVCEKLYLPTISPFNIAVAQSSHPESFKAIAKQGADTGNYSIQVKQIAKSDKIATKPIKRGTKLKGSQFVIKSGDQEVKIDFSKGGSVDDLYNIFDQKTNNIVKASVTNVENEKKILVIESLKKGVKNRLSLIGDNNFFKEVGFFIKPKLQKEKYYKLKLLKKRIVKGYYSIEKDALQIHPASIVAVTIPNIVKITKTTLIEAEIKVEKVINEQKLQIESKLDKTDASNRPIGTVEEIEVGRVKLYGEPLVSKVAEDNASSRKKKKIAIRSIGFLGKNDKVETQSDISGIKQIQLSKTDEKWKKIKINLGQFHPNLKSFNKLLLVNEFDNESLLIRKIIISDPVADKRLVSTNYNYIEKAQDSKLLFNGIPITRDKNEIEDLVRGVILTLKSPSNKTGTLNIIRDNDKITENLQKFVDEYNNVMLYLKNVMEFAPRKNLQKLEKEEEMLSKKSFEEKEYGRLSGEIYKGTMSRDFIMRKLKLRLREGMVFSPYPDTDKRDVKFLVQIGIKNPDRSGVKDNENLRAGYLYLDKKVLKSKLETDFKAVKDIFAHATEGSNVKNNGIAISLVKLIDTYTDKSTGVIKVKHKSLEKKLKLSQRRLEKTQKRTNDKANSFRRKMAKLENVVKQAESRRKNFENYFGNQK